MGAVVSNASHSSCVGSWYALSNASMDNDLLVVHLRFLGRVGEVHRITWMKNNITETLRCMQETIFAAG